MLGLVFAALSCLMALGLGVWMAAGVFVAAIALTAIVVKAVDLLQE